MQLHKATYPKNSSFFTTLNFYGNCSQQKLLRAFLILNQTFRRLNNTHQIADNFSHPPAPNPISFPFYAAEESTRTYLYVLRVNLISKECIKYPFPPLDICTCDASQEGEKKTVNKISKNKKKEEGGGLDSSIFNPKVPEGKDKLLPITLQGIEYNLCGILKGFANL